MNKKGFTLAELLAVITILAIIAVIAIPTVTNIINKNTEREYDLQIQNIEDKVNQYIYEHGAELPNSYSLNFSFYQLGESGVLDRFIIDPKTKKNFPIDSTVNINCNYDECNTTFTYGTDEYLYDDNAMLPSIKNEKIIYDSYDEIYSIMENLKLTYSNSNIEYNNNVNGVTLKYINDTTPPDEKVYTGKTISYYNVIPTLNNKLGSGDYYFSNRDSKCAWYTSSSFTYNTACLRTGTNFNNLFVWYSGILWNIMGTNADQTIRMIAMDSPYASVNNSYEVLMNNLNLLFFNSLDNNDIIVEQAYDETNVKRKVGLITSDIYSNSLVSYDSYLFGSTYSTTSSLISNKWSFFKNSLVSKATDIGTNVRPVISIRPDSLVKSGNGKYYDNSSSDNQPYIIDIDSDNKMLKSFGTNVESGEYVKFADNIYRVSSVDADGNVKIVKDTVFQLGGTDYTMSLYDSTSNFIGNTKFSTEVFNNLVPTDEDKNKVVMNNNWCLLTYNYDKSIKTYEGLCNDNYMGPVGILNFFERGSGQGYLNTNHYFLASKNDYIKKIGSDGLINNSTPIDDTDSIRPALVIKNDTIIQSGNGTLINPYQI